LQDDKTIYVNRGLVYQDMGNHQFAAADFNKALSLDPSYHEALYHIGISKLKSRRYQESIEDFMRAKEIVVNKNIELEKE
jgi:tetratricopeptide (TPR) repeat protein